MPEDLDNGVGQDSPVPPPPAPRRPASWARPNLPQYPAPTTLPVFPPRREDTSSRGRTTPGVTPPPPVLSPESPGTMESPVVLPGSPAELLEPEMADASIEPASVDTIATWPALTPEIEKHYPLSPRTGEPRRPRTLMVSIVFSWLSVACTIVAFGGWWWQAAHIRTFTSSARLLAWTHPDPVSALAIVMVMLIGLIGLLMVAAAGTVAYNSWAGRRWIRIGGLVCFAVTGLSFLLTWWFSIAMIPLVIGVGLLWLPVVNRFFTAMDVLQTVQPVDVPTTDIRYGPQTLIGRR